MARQEFYEQWRSKILQIPDLPLETDTTASLNDSLLGGMNIKGLNTPQNNKNLLEYANRERQNQANLREQERFPSNRGQFTPTPREQSLTVSMVEEEDDFLREKFKNAIQEEQLKNNRLKNQLGVQTRITEESIGNNGLSKENSSKFTSRPPYELYRVSDIFKSGFVGRGYDKRKAVSNLFKYRRGASVISPNKCQLYTPNEGVSRFQEPTEFLKCINCGLSMNSHQYLKFKVAFNNKALEYLRGLLFYQEMINDSDVVILIGTGLGSNTLNQESRENTLNMFLQQLSTCGLKVKDIARMTGRDMKIKLYSKYLILNCPLDEKDKFEDYIEHPEMEEDLRGGMRLTTVSFDDLRS
jgi:hypothetical protein